MRIAVIGGGLGGLSTAGFLARAGLEDVQHRIDEGVVAGAHVLHVEQHRVQAVQHRGSGDARAAVEAEDGQARGGVAAVPDFHEVLGIRPDPVLGAEEAHQPEARRAVERLGRVLQAGGDRGGIGDEAQAQAAEPPRLAKKPLETGLDPGAAPPHSAYLRVKVPTAALSPVVFEMLPSMVSAFRAPENRRGEPARSTTKRKVPLS